MEAAKGSLADLYPELAREWCSYQRGGDADLSPFTISAKSTHWVRWFCHNCGYGWAAQVSWRVKHRKEPCASCGAKLGRKAVAIARPDFYAFWHPTLNSVDPHEVGLGDIANTGPYAATWRLCPECQHVWKVPITYKLECPKCKPKGTSKIEEAFREALGTRLAGVNGDHTERAEIPELGRVQIDVSASYEGRNVAVFYDGSYWHRDAKTRDRDERVTVALLAAGWLVVRIREQDKHRLGDLDITHQQLLQVGHESHHSVEPTVETIIEWLARAVPGTRSS